MGLVLVSVLSLLSDNMKISLVFQVSGFLWLNFIFHSVILIFCRYGPFLTNLMRPALLCSEKCVSVNFLL